MAEEEAEILTASSSTPSTAAIESSLENGALATLSAATTANSGSDKATIAKLSAQLKRLTEANGKYKNLLKLAKERIQKQEDETESLRKEKEALEERLVSDEKEAAGHIALEETSEKGGDWEAKIVNVAQRVKVPLRDEDSKEEIWALMEMEMEKEGLSDAITGPTVKKFKEWRRFETESALQDFIRRDTGEPLTLPPYSLSPEQSARIQKAAESDVSKVTEEFRRFRVRAELARKQADAQIRDLQNNHVQRAAQRISGQDVQKELEKARSMGNQLERVKAEMAAQEAHWKESYDALLAENNALKSAGSEALLAAQWRQRYEACLKEKEELESRVGSNRNGDTDDKYEQKYRDLKESFRLYRKKAKEIFEAQQTGGAGGISSATAMSITSNSSADAKLSYLKNLMVNYLTADPAVRGHMEGAIATVLQFTPQEVQQMEKKKAESESWF